ncbi:FKBP-type peptidyl-prolyl cis-trans isomerase [Geomesophilobacter sediminis]|uniref:Peptidyl-prolyl cis-trans isomerase n=1 Tax=Geomesophilobacter sediminis TaxID=2798584 RepID=A0A8J7JF21_9BACT|nr:FKBP-type peptidyl-prolyl cis-trans isomerase [Geomesophilobacter sediminis]MBJ6725976.1 FKBP-type peptidyl-prolyl cis-trans isomerase [Geomesophilobacter sediminis]
MFRSAVAMLILAFAIPAFAADPPKTEEQKTLYAIGQIIAQQLSVFSLSPAELEMVKQGLADGTGGKKAFDISAYSAKVQDLARLRRKAQGEKLAAANQKFLETASREKGAVKSDSGLVFVSLSEGNGKSPAAEDTVKVNYRGTLADGTEFDSSYKRGKPLEFPLQGVIKCWTEGLQKMKEGGKARLFCPSSIAYGEKGAGELILPGAALAFEVELLEVKKP